MKLLDDELKSIRTELKKAIKGRPLYFALMAPGSKKGKFKLSKKKGDTKPADFKKNFNPYEDDKDNNLKGTACQGVVTGQNGVLTFHPQNKPPGAAKKFLDHFILREVKFKQVKDVVFAEPSENLPDVPDQSPLDAGLTEAAIRERLEELRGRFDSHEGSNRAAVSKALIEAQTGLSEGNLDAADEQLDLAEELLNAESAASTEEIHLASAPTEAADLSALQQRLNDAKDKAGKLPAGLLSNLASLISGAQNAISAGEPDAAEDAVIGLEEAIDGAYQDFFLKNLRLLVKAEDKMATNAAQLLNVVKRQVGLRNWSNAMTSFEELKRLLLEGRSATGTATANEDVDRTADTETIDLAVKWAEHRDSVSSDLKRCLQEQLGDTEKMRAVFRWAQEKAEAEDYVSAISAAEKLSGLLKEALASFSTERKPVQFSTSELSKARLSWESTRRKGMKEIERLLAALMERFGDEQEEKQTLTNAIVELEGVFDELDDELADLLDGAINEDDAGRRAKLLKMPETS